MRDFQIDRVGRLFNYTGNGGDVVIREGLTGIADRAFRDCSSLTSVTIREGVMGIGLR